MSDVLEQAKKTIQIIEGFLTTDESHTVLSRYIRNLIAESIPVMYRQIDQTIKEEEFEIEDSFVGKVERSLNFLLREVILNKATKKFEEFLSNYICLCFNWNKIYDDPGVARSIQSLSKFSEYKGTVNESILVLKTLIKEYKTISEFSPPAFKLAEGYLEALDDKYNNCNKVIGEQPRI